MNISELSILKNLNVLYVEDDEKMQQNIKSIFLLYFKSVYLASSIAQTIELIDKKVINIFFLDIELPDGSGIKLASILRDKYPATPIVILTNFLNIEFLHAAIPLNITNYIQKPLTQQILKQTLLECVKRLEAKYLYANITNNITYNYIDKSIKYNDKLIYLGSNEAILLELFITHTNKIVSKNSIEKSIYNKKEMSESAYKNLLLRFRKKLHFLDIKSIKNSGYMLSIDND